MLSGLMAKKRWSIWLKRYNHRWKLRKDTFRLFSATRFGRINLKPWLGPNLNTFRFGRSRLGLPSIGSRLGIRFSSFPAYGERIQTPNPASVLPAGLREKDKLPLHASFLFQPDLSIRKIEQRGKLCPRRSPSIVLAENHGFVAHQKAFSPVIGREKIGVRFGKRLKVRITVFATPFFDRITKPKAEKLHTFSIFQLFKAGFCCLPTPVAID